MFCKNSEHWLYKLNEDYPWSSGMSFPRTMAFLDRADRQWLLIKRNGDIVVAKDYSWDGCTPKSCIFDIRLGISDGPVHKETGLPKAYHASLIHDVLYQFLSDDLPLTRAQADRIFLRLLRERDFAPRWIYYVAVRIFGEFFRLGAKTMVRKTSGRRVLLD